MDKEDQALHTGLMKILREGTFPIMIKETHPLIAIYNWANDLPNKIKAEPVKASLVKKKTKKKVKK